MTDSPMSQPQVPSANEPPLGFPPAQAGAPLPGAAPVPPAQVPGAPVAAPAPVPPALAPAQPATPVPPAAAPTAPAAPPAQPAYTGAPGALRRGVPGPGAAPAPQNPAFDAATYTAVREPRGAGRLALDGKWHQISPRYVASQFVQNGIFLALVVLAASVVSYLSDEDWVWIPAGIVIAITVLTLVILPRQAKAIGYMLRSDDIVFRKGIIWQRMIAVPYGRLQLVDITQGPLDRAFGVSQLKMVTAAATTGVQIPGLTQAAAEALRDSLIEVAETRRTGL